MKLRGETNNRENMNTKRKYIVSVIAECLCAILHNVRTMDTTTVQHEKFFTTLKIVTFPGAAQFQTPLRNTKQRFSPGVRFSSICKLTSVL